MIENVWESSNQRIQSSLDFSGYQSDSFKLDNNSTSLFESSYDSPGTLTLTEQSSQLFANVVSDSLFTRQHQMLSLKGSNISDHQFAQLCKLLQNDSSIKHVILSHNHVAVSEFAKAAVMDLLKINRFIGWLVLNNNDIDDLGASNLAQALSSNSGIRHLVLSDNFISDDGCMALLSVLASHGSIESLFLAGNPLSDRSFQSLSQFIMDKPESFKRLDLRGCDLSESKMDALLALCKRYCVRLIYE